MSGRGVEGDSANAPICIEDAATNLDLDPSTTSGKYQKKNIVFCALFDHF